MELSQTLDLTTIIISIILLMVTFGTVIFAKRNLQAIDSPRLVVTNVKDRLTRETGEEQHFIKASVKNFGNGIALRTYLIVITKNKKHFLSKPLVTLERDDCGELEVDIGFKNEVKKAFIITHDFFDGYYKVDVDTKFDNSHLYSMVRPVKRISSYGLTKKRINRWMKKAKKQSRFSRKKPKKRNREFKSPIW
ncbi:hypothetical protein [Paenisporosarcina sp. TG20]|uniref:hypothetical protein n=1 Tax=Paenisporosarcina sp. TG20 TaxID=1211706 RepID=UPI0002F7B570|nr:hypothetical protein [Paenisporosarcina sp. TG20]